LTHPKTSGGGGFVFESKVAAYYLSSMLSGRIVFPEKQGKITEISFQNRPEGWFIDDILLTMQSENEIWHCAISVPLQNRKFERKS
jgi:hypothetical protein